MEKSEIKRRIARLSPEKRALLEQQLRKKTVSPPPERQKIGRRPPGQAAPLSFSEQRLWFLDQLDPGSDLYNIAQALHLQGPLV